MKFSFVLLNTCLFIAEIAFYNGLKEQRTMPAYPVPSMPAPAAPVPAPSVGDCGESEELELADAPPLLERSEEEQAQEMLIRLIKKKEGFYSRPYVCPAGQLTIGYGFTEPQHLKRKVLTEKEAHDILVNEIIPSYSAIVEKVVKVPLSPFQRAALVSFCYNCGEENLRKLVTGKNRLNSGNYESAPVIMQKYTKADGKTLKGLVSRRKAEAELFCGSL